MSALGRLQKYENAQCKSRVAFKASHKAASCGSPIQTGRRRTQLYATLGRNNDPIRRFTMNNDQQNEQKQPAPPGNQQSADQSGQSQQQAQPDNHPDLDGLADKKPEELTPEELRLMADTMPGEGPGD